MAAGLSYFGSSGGGCSPRGRPENIVHQTIATRIASASNASSSSSHMRPILRCSLLAAMAAALLGCGSVPRPPAPAAGPPLAPVTARPEPAPPPPERAERARWRVAAWADLPGWGSDRVADAWPALMSGCTLAPPSWRETCARALLEAPVGDNAVQRWLERHLQPWQVESESGAVQGLLTGYFEPTLDAKRRPGGAFRVPLYAPPAELAAGRPFFTRQQIDTLPEAAAALTGRELAFVEDPLDALLVQVQGSGRLRLAEADGRERWVRLAFAAHNEHPFRSPGRWLSERSELAADALSWPAIKAWARMNPERVQELLWANPRFVFFREEPLADPRAGPRGAQGVPLTPGRSIAVDPRAVPLGSAVWIDSSEPPAGPPLQRLVVAQDTGGAITGAVRADFFWGWSREAEASAGRTRQPLRWWVLWPRGAAPPEGLRR